MIVWLSIQIFQLIYDLELNGDSLVILQTFGFLELFVEIIGIFILLGCIFYIMSKGD